MQRIKILTQFDSLSYYCIQDWCSTKVDDEGHHIPGPDNFRICGSKCSLKNDAWKADDTLIFRHHYDENERMKLYGIMSSSLLLIGLLVTVLGILLNEI